MNTYSLRPNHRVFAAAALMFTTLAAHGAPPQAPPAAPVFPAAPQKAGVVSPAADIHDIRGPKPISSPWMVSLVAVTALLAAGGAYSAWAWNRRRFREASKRPLDMALERLEQARHLMVPPHGREFSIEVSSAIREYVESRFDVLATHLTTDEFLHQLLEPAGAQLVARRPLLEHFLQTCDLAKFGGWNLGCTEMEAMLLSARRFVVESAAEVGSHDMQPAADVPRDQPATLASRETYVSLPST